VSFISIIFLERNDSMEKRVIVLDIEGSDGNTIMAMQLDVTDVENIKVLDSQNCTLANIDTDYIFFSGHPILKIQED
jgi:hypothetical protein